MDKEVSYFLFEIKKDFSEGYKQGFIDEKAMLPADFCSLGIERFINDLNKFKNIGNVYISIINSIKEKVKHFKDERMVLPKELFYLLQKP